MDASSSVASGSQSGSPHSELAALQDEDDASPKQQMARHRHLPRATFGSVECLGPVKHFSALAKVMHQDDIDACFNTPLGQPAHLEMHYKMGHATSIPVRGSRVGTAKMLVRVKRRRRLDADGEHAKGGAFTTEVMGTIPSTVRFRSMADYHYSPKQETSVDEIASALRALDYNAILDYSVADLDETYTEPTDGGPFPFRSTLDLHPPPVFSYRYIPPLYNYKNNTLSVEQEVPARDGSGGTTKRLINRSRNNPRGMYKIGHQHSAGDVPTEPVKAVLDKAAKLNQALIQKLKELLEERPVWTRHGLCNQFTDREVRELKSDRTYFAAVAYTIGAGPFWKCMIRYGYDPCAHPDSRKYQRVYFYTHVSRFKMFGDSKAFEQVESDDSSGDENDDGDADDDGLGLGADGSASRTARRAGGGAGPEAGPGDGGAADEDGSGSEIGPKGGAANTKNRRMRAKWEKEQARRAERGERQALNDKLSHTFDGVELQAGFSDYQLCDISDKVIRRYLDDDSLLGTECDSWSGWYTRPAMGLIRNLIKAKFTHIYMTNTPPPPSVWMPAIETFEREMQAERESERGVEEEREEPDGALQGRVRGGEDEIGSAGGTGAGGVAVRGGADAAVQGDVDVEME